ncbi:MAG: alpha-N-arabinofuranosidase [Verrucomicrobiia bacterium]
MKEDIVFPASRVCPWRAGLIAIAAVLIAITATAEEATTNLLVIHADQGGDTISRNLYGQFSEDLGHCIYGGIWVGVESPIPNTRGIRNDIIAALKKIEVPVLRWPGGCYADDYHWMNGIGPRNQRPKTVNTSWGDVLEDNQFGTHEFLDFCHLIGAEPYMAGNMGSGTVREMADWIEYMTCAADTPMANLRRENGREQPWKIPFLGIGNESWGCGGNMTPEYCADNFLRYNTFIKDYDGNQIYRIASGASGEDYHWTDVLMRRVGTRMNGLSLHYYTIPTGNWSHKGSATGFNETGWFETLRRAREINTLITKHSAIMDQYDPQKKVSLIVDEWGAWYDVQPGTNPLFLYQQNTLRDALVAGLTLNILNQHCDRVKMACIAQMVNVLQAMILTDNEKMIVTPTYWVFAMYTVHHDAKLLPSDLRSADYDFNGEKIPAVSVSASRDRAGRIHVSLCNLNPDRPAQVTCDLQGAKVVEISGQVLTAPEMNAHNTFDQPANVHPAGFSDCKLTGNGFVATLPAKSVVVLELK